MKIKTYSQWMEEKVVPVRTKQFTKAAKLMGHQNFHSFAAADDKVGRDQKTAKSSDQQAVAEWLDCRVVGKVAEGVA
ncbi:MAG: hypothetical protein SPL39_03385 [Selenomonadaceae bacterium]|nr:hypothetical protein [Selenomonadaceae bacterium]